MIQVKPASSLYDYSFDELAELVGERRALAAFADLYRTRARSTSDLRALSEELGAPVAPLSRKAVTTGSMTSKYLFGLSDGSAIETVRIRRRTGYTACVSSQVGCGFGCEFCASGRNGLLRHLSSGEIVQQVLELGHRTNRVVFMGIGEPLHNYDNVLKAIRTLRDRRGLDMDTGGITISTIGVPKGLRRLREEHLKVNLTISLHATTQEVRTRLIPGSKSHPVEEVVALSQSWAERHNRVVTYTYLLLPGLTDGPADADRLAAWFAGRPARVNLMRWNPVDGVEFARVDDRTLSGFKQRLERRGVPAVVRDTQGRDIDAACGQLWLRSESTPVTLKTRTRSR